MATDSSTEPASQKPLALDHEVTGLSTETPPHVEDSQADASDTSSSSSSSSSSDSEPEPAQCGAVAAAVVRTRSLQHAADAPAINLLAADTCSTSLRTAVLPLEALLEESVRTVAGSNEEAQADAEEICLDPRTRPKPQRPADKRGTSLREAGRGSAKASAVVTSSASLATAAASVPTRGKHDEPVETQEREKQECSDAASSASLSNVAATLFTSSKDDAPAEAPEREEESDDQLQEEWANVGVRTEEMRQKELANAGRAVRAEDDPRFKFISYKEVHDWACQSTLDRRSCLPWDDEELARAQCACMRPRRFWSRVPKLDKRLTASKDIVLSLKMTNFNFNEEHHFRMLRTIFMKLSRNQVCPSTGSHWQDIGFQGGDPCTDLNRSGGVLNVYFLFYFFSHYFGLMKAAFLLAGSEEQHFPLACISINLTQMVVKALVAGKLNALCNSRVASSDVLETTCMVHAAAMHYFSHRWRTQKRTIKDTEKTMNEVRALLHKSPKQLLRELAKGEQDHRTKNDPGRWEFTNLSFGGARKASTQGAAPAAAGSESRSAAYGVSEA